MNKIQKGLAAVLAILLGLFVLFMLLGARLQEPERNWEPYVVRSGDTLYDIAVEVGAENPEKFSYEVCRKNGIPDGGLISPGDVIFIYAGVK